MNSNRVTELQDAFWIGLPKAVSPEHNGITNGITNGTNNSTTNSTTNGTYAILLRNTFSATATDTLSIHISANTRYRLWLNGKHITVGPCKSDGKKQYYETLDLTQLLVEGKNILSVKVLYFPPFETITETPSPYSMISKGYGACLMVSGKLLSDAGEIISDISTGKAPWKVQLDTRVKWNMASKTFWLGSIMEEVKGDTQLNLWQYRSYDDRLWFDAHVFLHSSKGAFNFGLLPRFDLEKRPIPLLYEKKSTFIREMNNPKDILPTFTFYRDKIKNVEAIASENENSCYIPPYESRFIELDAGEMKTAYFNLGLNQGKGSKIVITYAEAYYQKTEDEETIKTIETNKSIKTIRDDSLHGNLEGVVDIYYPSGSEEHFESFWFRTFRYVRVEVFTESEGVHIQWPYFVETGYPLDIVSEISSTCDWIKPLWDISAKTLTMCMHETYGDAPFYEQMQYILDTRLEILFTYALSNDYRLPKKAIRDIHASLLPEGILQARFPSCEPQVIPIFSVYWMFMIEDYYWQTGEVDFIKQFRPAMDSIVNWFDNKTKESGLIENLEHWQFVDWVKEWDDTYGVPDAVKVGPSTDLNLIYAAGLQCASRLNQLTGRVEVANEYEEKAARILQVVDRLCWCEDKGLYMEGPGFKQFSQHSQVWAVITGLAKGEKAQRILMKTISDTQLLQCTFPMLFFLFRALEKENLYENSIGIWNIWTSQLKNNLTTWPEIPTSDSRSDCHAWSSIPLYEFTRNFLGVRPLTPGFEGIEVKPMISYVKDLKGCVATPKGKVEVQWEYSNSTYSIQVTFPQGVVGKVWLPDGTNVILEDGGSFQKSIPWINRN
jgi:alpha-L-rhamnosidase